MCRSFLEGGGAGVQWLPEPEPRRRRTSEDGPHRCHGDGRGRLELGLVLDVVLS